MKHLQPFVVAVFAIVTGFGVLSPSLAAEQLDLTTCYSGSGAVFHDTKDAG